MNDLTERYIKNLAGTTRNGNISDNTIRNHRTALKRIRQEFPDMTKVKLYQIKDWFVDVEYSAGYKNILLTVMDNWLELLAEREIISRDMSREFHEFKRKAYRMSYVAEKPIPAFTKSQLEELFLIFKANRSGEERKNQNILIAGLLLFCGYRLSEVFEIKVKNIEFHEPVYDPDEITDYDEAAEKYMPYATISIPWNKFKRRYEDGMNTRYLFENAEFANIKFYHLLKRVAKNAKSDYLFSVVRKGNGLGSRQKPINFRNFFNSQLKKASFSESGSALSPHSFRKTFATWNDALPSHIVAQFLGHKVKNQTTELYQSSGRDMADWWKLAQQNIAER